MNRLPRWSGTVCSALMQGYVYSVWRDNIIKCSAFVHEGMKPGSAAKIDGFKKKHRKWCKTDVAEYNIRIGR